MKNYIRKMLFACGLLSLLASCIGDPETHALIPVEESIMLYADQTVDSLRFYTFDSWTVTPQADWITVDGDSHADITYDYTKRYLCRVILNVKPNTTGKTRSGLVLVKSHDFSYSSPLVQLGLLKITHPAYTPDSWLDDSKLIPNIAHFELIDSAHWESDSICFTVQNHWYLECTGTPEWLTFEDKTGPAGKKSVLLTLTKNTDTKHGREAKLQLTSGKVTNEITVRQLPAKED